LGYVSESAVGIVARNLPRSSTTASGDFNSPTLETTGKSGNREITHFGFNIPFAKGALGLTYTVGGFIDDFRTGNVTIGGDPVSNYAERIRAKTEFFTLAYGTSSRDQSFSWGAGVQFVQAALADQLAGTVNNVPLSGTDLATTNGLAGIIGVQFNPKGGKMSWGLSYRSEVNLSDNDSTTFLMDKIPARLMGGVAFRQDGLRGGKDFLVYGAELSHFFASQNGSQNFSRKEQTTAGFGFEYNHERGGARIPLRVGFNFVPGAGPGFGDRNAITFGIGYRPANERFSIDLNLARPQHGGFDLGLSLNYKLGSK
jgi:hypothetical protein